MSISFQSTSASSGSRNEAKARLIQQHGVCNNNTQVTGTSPLLPGVHHPGQYPSFLGGIFHKRERKLSKSDEQCVGNGPFGRSTEV